MRLARLAEVAGAGVERAVDADEIARIGTELRHARALRRRVGRLLRPEAAVAAAVVRRADGAAAGVRDGPEARRAVRHHDADSAAALALDANAVRADARTAPVE